MEIVDTPSRPLGQLVCQSTLSATSNAVTARAPLEGFLHQTNRLDALAIVEPETMRAPN